MAKISINIAGEHFVLETEYPDKVKQIEEFINGKLEASQKVTGVNDTKKNLTFSFLSVVVELWDNVKETFGVDDGLDTVKDKIELINTKIIEKIEELDNGMD